MKKFQFPIYIIVEQEGADEMDARNRMESKFYKGRKLKTDLPSTNSMSRDKTDCEIAGKPVILPRAAK